MYKVRKQIEISAAHSLKLPYESKCANLHGHNWNITIYCASETLNDAGMVIDFTHIKNRVHAVLDHTVINDVIDGMNPTAENIAKWVHDIVPYCYRVDVEESNGNTASYED